MKKAFITLTTLIMAAVFILMPVSAAGNGSEANVLNKNSGRLIIGDSRCYQLYEMNSKAASFVAVWGGHFGHGYPDEYTINTAARRKDMKKYVKATIKAKGKCNVFIFATINDYNYGSGYNGRINRFIQQAREIKNWSFKYNGKAVKPKVYIVKLIGFEPEQAEYNYNIADFNKRLVKLAKKNKITTLDFSSCLQGKYQGYKAPWDLHYSKTTLKKMWKRIKTY